ncbi:MAG TPA: flagellar basal body P-ring formation chaperone FlgA [Armatimonadota bacterium]
MNRWLILGITLLAALGARAMTLEFPATATIRGEAILLGEIAKVDGSQEECARLNVLSLGAAPAPGQSRDLTIGMIRSRLRQSGVDPTALTITGPESVRVSRTGITVTGEMLVSTAQDWLAKQYTATDGIERTFRPLSTPTTQTVPDGALALSCAAVSLDTDTLRSVAVSVAVDTHPTWRGIITFRVQRVAAVLVTRVSLQRGIPIKDTDVTVEKRELSTFSGTPLSDVADVKGMCAARTLPPGTVLTTTSAMAIPLVKRDSLVRVRAVCGTMVINLQALAIEDGGRGEQIRVRNVQSRQEFLARVTGPGEVELADAPAEGDQR